jgi:hypothetical protein
MFTVHMVRLSFEPEIELADNYGLRGPDIQTARRLIEEHENEIRNAWQKHFGS